MSYPVDYNDTVVYNGVDLYVPKDCSCTVMEDSRVFLFGEFYLNGQPILTGAGVSSGAEVNVGPTQPVDPGITLWFDTSSGYGELKAKVGGSWKTVENPADDALHDEIYIGGVEPVGGNYELWVDTATDPPAPGESYISVGNALGIVATGSLINADPLVLTAATKVQITNNLAVSLTAGRKYRVVIEVRGIQSSSTTTIVSLFLRDGTTDLLAFAPLKFSPTTQFDTLYYEWILEGDGLTKNLNVAGQSAAVASNLYTNSQGYFYVEDVGPNTRPALPMTVPYPDGYVSPGNALGVVKLGVGKGTNFQVSAGILTAVTEVLSVTLNIGRLYKIVCGVRAYTAAVAGPYTLKLYDNGTVYPGTTDIHRYFGANFAGPGNLEWLINGDGLVHNFDIRLLSSMSASGIYIDNLPESRFYIEDIGPNTSPALPLPATPPAWTPLTLVNNWTNLGADFAIAAIQRVGDRRYMRGVIKNGTPTPNALITTLDVIDRPTNNNSVMFAAYTATAGPVAIGVSRLDVRISGQVNALYIPSAGSVDFITLSSTWSVA